MPAFHVNHRVLYDFLVRPRGPVPGATVRGEARPVREAEAEALFPLQEAYEKEEVLFEPGEFQALASRLHFQKVVRQQEVLGLWEGGRPVAKAGTNALTGHWGQIGGVYTRPEFRGQGFQKSLMSALLARLEGQGRGACLFVKKANLAAGSLYRSLGFAFETDFTILYGERRFAVPGFR